MLFFRTRKGSIVAGLLIVAIAWIVKMPMFIQWVSTGLMSAISFLLLFCAVMSLLIGALRVRLGKRGTMAFLLHIAFAALACWRTHFLFTVPLALGVLVAISALVWPASTQQGLTGQSGAESA